MANCVYQYPFHRVNRMVFLQKRPSALIGLRIAAIAAATIQFVTTYKIVFADEGSNRRIVESLLAGLKTTSPSKVRTSAAKAEEILHRLRSELSEQAIGVVLGKELLLDQLASELQSEQPNGSVLRQAEKTLRRTFPGRVQHTVNELRASVADLALQVSSTPANLEDARRSIAIVQNHLNDDQLRKSWESELELRAAFQNLSELHPSVGDLEELRKQLTFPNYSSLIKKDFLTTLANRSFELPIHFREHRDGTAIVGNGKFKVDLSLALPPSVGESRLMIHAVGTGQINTSADRGRAHVQARILPSIHGTQILRIRADQVSGDTPHVAARLNTHLTSIQLDGLLGRCGLIERVAARAVQKKLSESDRSLSNQIEQSVQGRVEDEGFDLAYRINGLLRLGIWDRIQSLDFEPDIRLQNDSEGIRSDIHYVRNDQFAALSQKPEIPGEVYPSLDLISWVHESVANNALDAIKGVRLDEATIRGLWRVEFKLTSDDWERTQAARIPAVIELADQFPLQVRFLPQGVELVLRATACEIDDVVLNGPVSELLIRYRLEADTRGIQIIREHVGFPESLPIEQQAIWLKAIDRFFPQSARPAPKFSNASTSQLLRLTYLTSSHGWIVAGASRLTPSIITGSQALNESLR